MKPSNKFMRFVEYCIKHAPILRNHIAFGEQMQDIQSEITLLEDAYGRVLSAAQGRGMVSEMDNMEEVAVLVCGLHDRLAQYEVRPTQLAVDCAYCHCSTAIIRDGVHCVNCGRVYKSHSH